MEEHRNGENEGFTKRYNIHRLVYFEKYVTAQVAIAREKQLKGCLRARKIALIEEENRMWDDLYVSMIADWHAKMEAVKRVP